jgi:hypothetical protein
VPSPKAGLLAKIAGWARAFRSRAAGWLLALLGAIALADLAGLVSSTHGAGTGLARQTVTSRGTPWQAAAPLALYRIAGCRSRGRSAYLHGPKRRQVAIGFDDGPAPDTNAFVTMLERAKTTATFFMIGRQVVGQYRNMLLREL